MNAQSYITPVTGGHDRQSGRVGPAAVLLPWSSEAVRIKLFYDRSDKHWGARNKALLQRCINCGASRCFALMELGGFEDKFAILLRTGGFSS